MSCGHGDLPPPPSPMEMVNRRAVSQTNTGASMPPSASSVETNNSGVDISRLQPDPVMDQLRPRQSGDPAWAPHHYIQKGGSSNAWTCASSRSFRSVYADLHPESIKSRPYAPARRYSLLHPAPLIFSSIRKIIEACSPSGHTL